ncbi:uncharacterized protein LOC135468785 [Liolophura sinensis]|uniref:uncharacterized protein LOC135468785 n=1 Tax=Liolophura sinensis TaxID=3198878 RepID=UPI0031589089
MPLVIKRTSFHSSQDKSLGRSKSSFLRRYSDDSCKLDTYQENPEALLMSSLGSSKKAKDRLISNTVKQPESRIQTGNVACTGTKKTNTDVKSILKKQNSLERINYSNLFSLLTAECNNGSNERKTDDNKDSDGVSFPVPIRSAPTKAQNTRRVRFNENVSFRFSESDAICLLEDCFAEVNEADCVTLESVRHLDAEQTVHNEATWRHNEKSDTKLPDASQRLVQERTKAKKDIRVEPVPKRTRLSSCGNFMVPSKTAWAKTDTTPISDEPHTKKSVDRKLRANIPVCGRSLDRSKTDMGLVSYKDVQSKLRRMGFLDFNNTLSGRKNDKTNPKFAYCAENDKRNKCRYSTVREEFYDIRHNSLDEISPVKHVTGTCVEAGVRSLGDEYALFLKGRYKVDDITCS